MILAFMNIHWQKVSVASLQLSDEDWWTFQPSRWGEGQRLGLMEPCNARTGWRVHAVNGPKSLESNYCFIGQCLHFIFCFAALVYWLNDSLSSLSRLSGLVTGTNQKAPQSLHVLRLFGCSFTQSLLLRRCFCSCCCQFRCSAAGTSSSAADFEHFWVVFRPLITFILLLLPVRFRNPSIYPSSSLHFLFF